MASSSFDPTGVPLTVLPAYALVVRYTPGSPFALLPNVVCVEVRRGTGPDPGSARLRYILDELNPPGFPDRVEDVLGLDRSGPYVASQDDRLLVVVPDGGSGVGYTILFDGFAQVPQGDISPTSEGATFDAVGVATRCWDDPLGGALYRNGPDPTVVSDTRTDRPARFNPDGKPNRVPSGAFAGLGMQTYPTFLDPVDSSDSVRVKFSVADAAAYIIADGNDEAYVTSPNLTTLPNILCDLAAGITLIDPQQQAPSPIPCQDLDVTGEPWPEALAKLIHPHNFDFAFVTSQTATGKPLTFLYFFRTDGGDKFTAKPVYLQAAGQPLDPSLTTVDALGVARDGSKIANDIIVDTQCTRHEIAVVLAPSLAPVAGDVASKGDFDSDSATYVQANQDKYRVYVANEAGDGYYSFPFSAMKTTPVCDFSPVFGNPVVNPVFLGAGGPPVPRYANRRRPGLGTLFTKQNGDRLHAKLYISRDYNGTVPGVWDRTGSWSEVKSDWELLPDKLGVRITTAKISDFDFTVNPFPGFGTLAINPGGKLSLVESQNNAFSIVTTNMSPRVVFMVVCVVESDRGLGTEAPPRAASISRFGITRRIDARDRFVKHVIGQSSPFNAAAQDVIDRDDTNDAQAYAEGVRASSENATFQGTISIPWISGSYEVGDKISGVYGRGINLRTNGGAGQGEAAQYGIVTGLTWTFEPRQSTSLHMSDMRKEAAPPPEHQT